MKKMIIYGLCFGAISLTCVTGAFAVWTSTGKVSDVYAGSSNGDVVIRGLSNTAGCTKSDILFTAANSDTKKVRQLATAALMSQANFLCSVDSCIGDQQRGYYCRLMRP